MPVVVKSVLGELLANTSEIMRTLSDPREKSNGQKYELHDIAMGGLSIAVMQDASFLQNQARLRERTGQDNFQTLFNTNKIPSPNQVRRVLDKINPENFNQILDEGLIYLQRYQQLEQFETDFGYLIALDGTEYHSSCNIK